MTIRYCPRCKTDVEDTGGYCLLGHRLALDPPVASLDDLRAEVDRAFEEARLQVAAVSGNAASATSTSIAGDEDVPTAPIEIVATPPSSLSPERIRPAIPSADPASETGAPRRMPPPPPPPRRTPAPAAPAANEPASDVPSAEELVARNASVWKELDREVDMVGDPIGAFAPPPHMDWGPDKSKALKRKPARRFRRTSDASE